MPLCRLLLGVVLVAGCWTHYAAPVESKGEPKPITVAVIEFGDRKEAESGCVMAVLEAGHRVVDKKLLDSVLPNDDDIDYQKLGAALAADLIIDGGLARGVKMKQLLEPRIVSTHTGDLLAAYKGKRRADRSFATGHDICAELLNQLP